MHPPGWTTALEWTLPHVVKGPPGTTVVREMGPKRIPPPSAPKGREGGRMTLRRTTGRAVPSPEAPRRATLKQENEYYKSGKIFRSWHPSGYFAVAVLVPSTPALWDI